MEMKHLIGITLVLFSLMACQPEKCKNPDNKDLYSDYFVFIADDGGDRVVIPMDMNWNPTATGYSKEFKSWYGTSNAWPINYLKEEVTSDLCAVPQESWEHIDDSNFQFDEGDRIITTNIAGEPPLELLIPEESEWTLLPEAGVGSGKETYGFRTSARVNGVSKDGWVIYERIRATGSAFTVDFEDFYWFPLIINGDFYFFEQHKGEQVAAKFTNTVGGVTVDTTSSFNLMINSVLADSVSGRNNVPQTFRIEAAKWGVDISLKSTGFQVGYGPQFQNGLGLYRQSMLEPDTGSVMVGYGMLELILENY
jgi:hypothetical protein